MCFVSISSINNFDVVSCVGVLLSGEWVFDISLAWHAVNLKRYVKRDDC